MRPVILALALAALAPVALADTRLKGATCPGNADAYAIARLAEKSAATGRAQTLRSTCNGETRTYLIRETASGASTTLRVTELTGASSGAVIRAGAKRDFNASSAAKVIRVPRD